MLCSLPWEAALMTRVFVRCRHSPRSRFRRRTEKAAAESPWTFRTRSWPRRAADMPAENSSMALATPPPRRGGAGCQIPFIKGEAIFGTNVETGYYDQEQRNLHDSKSVLGELWDEHPTTPEKDIRTILGSFLFTGEDVDKPVHALSGGERARLLLTKLAMQNNNFLILDEPTNHLDIDSREVLEVALNDFDGTLLFVSHDRYFINQVATSVVEVSPEGTELFLGDYDYYVDKKQEQAEIEAAAASEAAEQEANATASPETTATAAVPRSKGQQNYQASKQQQREKRKLERSVAALEEQMTALDEQATKIQAEMSQPDVAADIGKLQDLQKELNALSTQQETVETDWTEQAEALEELD